MRHKQCPDGFASGAISHFRNKRPVEGIETFLLVYKDFFLKYFRNKRPVEGIETSPRSYKPHVLHFINAVILETKDPLRGLRLAINLEHTHRSIVTFSKQKTRQGEESR